MALQTLKNIRAIKKPGMHSDGGGLYLKVTKSGSKSWIYRFQLNGNRREMGLGATDVIGLARARQLATECREKVGSGKDPIELRKADVEVTVPTFRELAVEHILQNESGWSNDKHAKQWTATLERYAYEVIGELAVNQIETRHILNVLEPIWSTKAETAKRVRGRIEAILDRAKVLGYRDDQNPATWRGHLSLLLPAKNKIAPVRHHPALAYQDAPRFLASLREREGFAALGFQFMILTAMRTGEVRGATWQEIKDDRWEIKAERMKARRPHQVPLSNQSLDILERARNASVSEYIFPGYRGPLSNMAFLAILKRMKRQDITPHGFRSTFRDWAAETTSHPSDVVEMALAHTVANKVEAAYRRGDLFEKRRALMADWAEYLSIIL
jgi:integrase